MVPSEQAIVQGDTLIDSKNASMIHNSFHFHRIEGKKMWAQLLDSTPLLLFLFILWIAPIFLSGFLFRKKGYSPHLTWLAVPPFIGLLVFCVALLLRDKDENIPTQPKTVAPAPPPPNQDLLVVILSTLLIAIMASMFTGKSGFIERIQTPLGLGGALIGFILGSIVVLDNRALSRRLNKETLPDPNPPHPEIDPTPVAAPSLLPAILMLLIPLASGILLWRFNLAESSPVAHMSLVLGTIISTALLGYWNMRQRIQAKPNSNQPANRAIGTYLMLLGFWFPGYALFFLLRPKREAFTLFIPGLLSAGVFLYPQVNPLITTWFNQAKLPPVGSPEVLASLMERVKEHPFFQARPEVLKGSILSQPTDIAFDYKDQRRIGRAILVAKEMRTEIYYAVGWGGPDKKEIQVKILEN